MAKIKTKTQKKAKQPVSALPFTRRNYIIFAIGIALILVGYVALAQGPADSYLSLSLAPILLVVGYCVVIPIAILYRPKENGNS